MKKKKKKGQSASRTPGDSVFYGTEKCMLYA